MQVVEPYEESLDRSPDMVLREAADLYDGGGRLRKTYDRLSTALDRLGVAHSLIGGYAVFLHGVRRFTEDIDVLITEEGLGAIREELVGRGYTIVPGSKRSIRDAETGVRVDFVIAGAYPGDGEAKPLAFPDPAEAGEKHDGLRVVDLRTLIELKLASGMTAAGRLQDLADVQRLIEGNGLDENYARNLNPYVREKFVELCEGRGSPVDA